MTHSFLAFLGGPDTALTIRNTVVAGRGGGVFTALGVTAGQLIWAIFTSAGGVAILLASEPVFYAVKLAGAVFFASIPPQFAAAGHGMLSAFSILTFAWLAFYATVVSAAGGVLRTPGVRRVVEAVAGAVLIGLGVRLAAEGR